MDDLHTLRVARLKAIGCKVVGAKILAVIVGSDIVNVNLITFLDVIKEEVIIGHGEDKFLHFGAHCCRVVWILNENDT